MAIRSDRLEDDLDSLIKRISKDKSKYKSIFIHLGETAATTEKSRDFSKQLTALVKALQGLYPDAGIVLNQLAHVKEQDYTVHHQRINNLHQTPG